MSRLAVLSVASEIYPLVKTGGLADVAGALPAALEPLGIAMRNLVPGYPAVLNALGKRVKAHALGTLFGGEARLLEGKAAGLDLLVLDAPHLFDRPGNPYLGPDGRDWPDNALRFAALAQAAVAVGQGRVPGFEPAVLHAHDWQAGLVPAYLHYAGRKLPKTVITVHNLAFQGRFPRTLLATIDLPDRAFTVDGVEYHGDIGYLKAGLLFADRITTVSPTYAAEICTPEGGMGLDGLLRTRSADLSGILNGIDDTIWDPAADAAIAAPFDVANLAPRSANKAALQRRFGLSLDPDAPLFGLVSRLSWQKGIDLLLDALPALLAEGAQLAVLGSGDAALERALAGAQAHHPGQVACHIGYDEALSHLMQAGADALLVPSRFEPCGLTQLYALRYGCMPVVSRVGGLADTVIDANPAALAARSATGVQFLPLTGPALALAIRRTVALYRDRETWRALQANGMGSDFSWRAPARDYARLYRELAA